MLKMALAATALAASSAFAATALPSSGNGSLVLYVRDLNTPTRVYARDLGLTVDSVMTKSAIAADSTYSGPKDFTYNLGAPIGPDANLTSFLSTASSYVWTIMAGDSTGTNLYTNSRRYVTTTQTDLVANPGSVPSNNQLNTGYSTLNNMQTDLNAVLGANPSTPTNGMWSQQGTAYTTANTWFGNGLLNENALGANATLYVLGSSAVTAGLSTNGALAARVYHSTLGLTLSSNGTLSSASATSTVPLPPALYLFGSALAGLVGVARRRLPGLAAAA
jgi:hypothetical protein